MKRLAAVAVIASVSFVPAISADARARKVTTTMLVYSSPTTVYGYVQSAKSTCYAGRTVTVYTSNSPQGTVTSDNNGYFIYYGAVGGTGTTQSASVDKLKLGHHKYCTPATGYYTQP